ERPIGEEGAQDHEWIVVGLRVLAVPVVAVLQVARDQAGRRIGGLQPGEQVAVTSLQALAREVAVGERTHELASVVYGARSRGPLRRCRRADEDDQSRGDSSLEPGLPP